MLPTLYYLSSSYIQICTFFISYPILFSPLRILFYGPKFICITSSLCSPYHVRVHTPPKNIHTRARA